MLTQIHNEAAFWALFGSDVSVANWSLDAGKHNQQLKAKEKVSGATNPPYRANGGTLLVNPTSGLPQVVYRVCSNNDLNVNLIVNDPVLAADDNDGIDGPTNAPLQLLFENPVRAVGTYVAINAVGTTATDLVQAAMFVQIKGAGISVPVTQIGHCGNPVPGGPPSAPFLGAQCASGLIESVGFDATAMKLFDKICIGNLLWVP